jgi:sulfotransferase
MLSLVVAGQLLVDNGLHFVSGLPRSGSTLFGALLAQNPRFHGGMSSPVYNIFTHLQTMLSGRNEFHVFIDDRKRSAILRGIFDNYYQDVHTNKRVFDTSRGWCTKLAAISSLFPESKLICCVRPLVWILDSLERIVQANALEPSMMFNFEAAGSVYNRLETLNSSSGLVGAAYGAVKEAFFGPYSNKIILITYESLTQKPRETMMSLYDFLGEEYFEHDFDNVEFNADEFDIRLGTRGLHRVARKVTNYENRKSVLPLDIIRKFKDSAFWNDASQNLNGVKVV